MENEESYSFEILDEWKKFFDEDAVAYLKSAQDKILYSILDMNGFYSVQKVIADTYRDWNRKLMTRGSLQGSLSDVLPDTTVDYFGGKIPSDLLLDKIHLNFFSTIHSFFDTYGQFLFRVLFPTEVVPSRLYFTTVKSKIEADASMVSIATTIVTYTSADKFTYISDIDNVNKHDRHISPKSTLYLNDGELTNDIPAFQKDRHTHSEKSMEDLLEDSSEFIMSFFRDVTTEVLAFLKGKSVT